MCHLNFYVVGEKLERLRTIGLDLDPSTWRFTSLRLSGITAHQKS